MNDIIEFKGELFGKTRKFILDKLRKRDFYVSLFISSFFAIFNVLAAIYCNPICLIFLVALISLPIISLFAMTKKSQKELFPNRIFIDKIDECIVIQGAAYERFHMLSTVKNVYDYGEFYYFSFYHGDGEDFAICQKSLLTTGTLEEFEEIFSDKLVRKY